MYTTKRQNKSYHASTSHFMLDFNISYKTTDYHPFYPTGLCNYEVFPSRGKLALGFSVISQEGGGFLFDGRMLACFSIRSDWALNVAPFVGVESDKRSFKNEILGNMTRFLQFREIKCARKLSRTGGRSELHN